MDFLEKFLIPAAKTDQVFIIQNGKFPEELMQDNFAAMKAYIDARSKYVKDHLSADITWITAIFGGAAVLFVGTWMFEKRRKDKIKPVVFYEPDD